MQLWARLIAVLERKVYVHALETLELLGTLETAANPKVTWLHHALVQPCMEANPSKVAGQWLT